MAAHIVDVKTGLWLFALRPGVRRGLPRRTHLLTQRACALVNDPTARLSAIRNNVVLLFRKQMIRPFGSVQPQIHDSAYVDESAQVIGDVQVGEESSIWCNATVRGDMFFIRIGNRTNVQDNSVIHTRTGTHPTILEDEVTIGHSVTLHGCYIERGALIGIGSIVLDDVRVGSQSLVAAGCLMTPGTIIPPRSLVMGAPAKVKRPLTDEEVASLDLFWQNYVEYIPTLSAPGFRVHSRFQVSS